MSYKVKSEREKQILHIDTHLRNLKKVVQMNMKGRSRDTDVDTGEGGMS